jgi:glutathione S-transferase
MLQACPWAHRAHIALAELKVPFDEEIIDLSVPRTPEYLKVNPRGLVPSISYDGQIITESAIVATFLADAFPPTLLPASTDPKGPLVRAKINFFVDTYFSKVAVSTQRLPCSTPGLSMGNHNSAAPGSDCFGLLTRFCSGHGPLIGEN